MARQSALSTNSILLYLIALLFPPLTVFITHGCGGQFILNIILTILGFFPGLIHAWFLVARADQKERRAPREDLHQAQGHGGGYGSTNSPTPPQVYGYHQQQAAAAPPQYPYPPHQQQAQYESQPYQQPQNQQYPQQYDGIMKK